MTPLYAIDFDKTLVPYDSFRRYLLHLWRLRPLTMSIWIVLRATRIISGNSLKEKVTRMVERSAALTKDAHRFASRLVYDVSWPRAPRKEEQVLILSASPMVYMRYVAEILQTKLLCSDYNNNEYTNLYGIAKQEALHTCYPREEYRYAYAVSDSQSDLCWMQEFDEYLIVENE